MDPYERFQIADALKQETYKKDDLIIKEGNMGDKFYMVIEGEAVALKKAHEETKQEYQQVYTYKDGDYFGERALITNEARAASIKVTVSIILYLKYYSLKS